MAILRFGIKQLIPSNIKLISGPGCPVCVTPDQYIDMACEYARRGFLIVTFGDMMRVPGTGGSLGEEKSRGRKVKVVYSSVDALRLARSFSEEKVVFLGIGFETTAPTVAASICMAKEEGVKNFMVLCGHKLIPPAMKALVENPRVRIDGFLCPGHVSTIIGTKSYEFLARDYHIPCVVAGFEPLDILQGINLLLSQICQNEAKVENEGLGVIEDSGLTIAEDYSFYNAQFRFPVETAPSHRNSGCRCGEVLQGLIEPEECSLFGTSCNPSRPFGPCMVSAEGACNIHYRFGARDKKNEKGCN